MLAWRDFLTPYSLSTANPNTSSEASRKGRGPAQVCGALDGWQGFTGSTAGQVGEERVHLSRRLFLHGWQYVAVSVASAGVHKRWYGSSPYS